MDSRTTQGGSQWTALMTSDEIARDVHAARREVSEASAQLIAELYEPGFNESTIRKARRRLAAAEEQLRRLRFMEPADA